MIENQTAHPSIPLLKGIEEPLARITRQLEELYTELRLVEDQMTVCREACKSDNIYIASAIESVLRRCASNHLYRAMKTLTEIVERFGGRTEMSEERQESTVSSGEEP